MSLAPGTRLNTYEILAPLGPAAPPPLAHTPHSASYGEVSP